MNKQAKILGKAVVITLPEIDGEPEVSALVVEIGIDCPDCGTHVVRYAGHHLRSIRDLLVQWIDEYPELCGAEGGHKVAERLSFRGGGGSDPSVN